MFLINDPRRILLFRGGKSGWLTWLKDDFIINGLASYR